MIPLVGAEDRVTPEAQVRVYETRDAGSSWTAHGDGLPGQRGVPHDLPAGVRRRRARAPTLQLYFGATSGDVFGSADAGASWFQVHERLAPVTSVRVA